jgi:hypothetical protein
VLNSVADFDRAEIETLMAAALKLAKLRLDASAKGSVIIKAEARSMRAPREESSARPLPVGRRNSGADELTARSPVWASQPASRRPLAGFRRGAFTRATGASQDVGDPDVPACLPPSSASHPANGD